MKTSGITTFNSNIGVTKNKKRKILESTAILAGTTAVIPASFLISDNFSNNKKNYIKSVEKEKDIFEKNVQKKVYMDIQKLLTISSNPITDEEMQILRDNSEMQFRTGLEEKLSVLKKLRKSYINRGLKISAGIGISLGTDILGIKNIYEKRKNQSIQINPTTLISNSKKTSNNSLSFGKKKNKFLLQEF